MLIITEAYKVIIQDYKQTKKNIKFNSDLKKKKILVRLSLERV
jgi:hypothetical protein